jgi:glycosyl transferase family 87
MRRLPPARGSFDVKSHYRAVLGIWAVMALMNLTAGLAIASWPDRQRDLETMRGWAKEWVVDGSDIYRDEESPDYPPLAIVTLSPLVAVPAKWLVPTWAGINLGLALLAPYLAVRSVRPTLTLADAALPMLMLLCWSGFRTLLQFSLFALTLGLLSMVLSEKRPTWAGVCLGFALTKPQMAAPFLLWALFTRRLRPVAVAFTVAAAGLVVYCLRVRANPVMVVVHYIAALRMIYTGDTRLVGLAELRPLIAQIFSSVSTVDLIAATIAMLLLAVVCVVGFAEGRWKSHEIYSAPSLAGLWSLLTFRHLTYGFILLLPTATLLMLANDPLTLTFRKRVFWLLQFGLIVDEPGLWRRFGHLVPVQIQTEIDGLLIHADRALMLVLFVCILRLAWRGAQVPKSGSRAVLDHRPGQINTHGARLV